MELKLIRKNFLKLSLLIEKITGKNLNLPILSCFLISTEKGRLKINSTNLEIGFEVKIPAKIKTEGKIAVPAKIINNTILNLNEDVVNFKTVNSNLKIYTKNTSIIINSYSSEDFPIFPKFKKESYFSIKKSKLLEGLKSVYFSSSLSNIKPEIASVFIYNNENYLIFAATDSFRLAEKKINEKITNNISFLIPYKNCLELIRFLEGLENKEEEIDIFFGENQLFISSDYFLFFSILTEGLFPDYKQIIPKEFSTKITLDTEFFLNSLKSSSVFMNNLNEIKIISHPNDNLIEITTVNSNFGEYNSHIPASINGDKIELSFNLKYLIDGLQQINSSNTVLMLNKKDANGRDKPMILKEENSQDFIYLVMPMKT